MKALKYILLLLLIVAIAGCKSRTVEDEFYKTHRNKGQEMIYQGSAMERPFILYKSPFNNGKMGIGLAVFDGSDAEGWKLSASNSMYNETKLLVEQTGITFSDHVRRHLIYGWIEDPEVYRIEMLDKNNQIIEASIIQTNWKRVYYGLVEMNELRMRAYDKNNKLLVEVPFKDMK